MNLQNDKNISKYNDKTLNTFENNNNFRMDRLNNEIKINDKTIIKKNSYATKKPRKRKKCCIDKNDKNRIEKTKKYIYPKDL